MTLVTVEDAVEEWAADGNDPEKFRLYYGYYRMPVYYINDAGQECIRRKDLDYTKKYHKVRLNWV